MTYYRHLNRLVASNGMEVFMQAINAIYDGINFKAEQPIPVKGQYKVIITFLEPIDENVDTVNQIKKRPISELKGFLKGKVWMSNDFNEPLEEMKEYME